MRRFLIGLAIFLIVPFTLPAQDSVPPAPVSPDAAAVESMKRTTDSLEQAAIDRNARNNADNFKSLQTQSLKKQKRDAFLRIGLGLFFLLVLIVGLMRKRKKRVV